MNKSYSCKRTEKGLECKFEGYTLDEVLCGIMHACDEVIKEALTE